MPLGELRWEHDCVRAAPIRLGQSILYNSLRGTGSPFPLLLPLFFRSHGSLTFTHKQVQGGVVPTVEESVILRIWGIEKSVLSVGLSQQDNPELEQQRLLGLTISVILFFQVDASFHTPQWHAARVAALKVCPSHKHTTFMPQEQQRDSGNSPVLSSLVSTLSQSDWYMI